MAQKVYGLVVDHGDGSSSMRWFTNKALVDKLLEDEEYYANEGSPSEILTFPDDLNLNKCGFVFCDNFEIGDEDECD